MSSDKKFTSLYAKHIKIHPKHVKGKFAALRVLGVATLLGLYFVFPWFTWNGRQAVLFDLPARKFHYFGVTFWPQDFFYLALLLIVLAFALFFFTTLAGRLWCGYSCPQTVWTEVFMWIERWCEGDRNQRIKNDAAAFTKKKAIRKLVKHSAWLVISWVTAYTFVGYFVPIHVLTHQFLTFDVQGWALFWILFFMLATYVNAGWMREQVCFYMCPYARFQSAMFDRDTLIISYDKQRGENRGSRKRDTDIEAANLGHCIDCKLCVQVCPTGIDIRDGLQYECIGCAACVDVCDQVMDKMEYPRGLVKYTTESKLLGLPSRILRPRVLLYTLLLCVLVGSMSYTLINRIPLELDIMRDRNQLYQTTTAGEIENVYTLKLINMSQLDDHYALTIDGNDDLTFEIDENKLAIQGNTIQTVPVRIRIPQASLVSSRVKLTLTLQSTIHPRIRVAEHTNFIGPME